MPTKIEFGFWVSLISAYMCA